MKAIAVLLAGVVVYGSVSCSARDAPQVAPTSVSATVPSTTVSAVTISVRVVDGEVTDAARDRRIPFRAYLPDGAVGDLPVVLVSHGGDGSPVGYRTAPHLGTAYAEAGFIAIHIGHLASGGPLRHRIDRPADVSFVLDRLEDETLPLPEPSTARADLTRVAHVGHSYGAYTAHALAGADFGDAAAADPRIDAIVPLSPQGAGQFGGYDNGSGATSWSTVTVPVYTLIGSQEMNDNALGTTYPEGWRLTPFRNYPGTSDTFVTVIDGQQHSDLWRTGSDEVKSFIADQTSLFLLIYVAGEQSLDACDIGQGSELFDTQRATATEGSLILQCP